MWFFFAVPWVGLQCMIVLSHSLTCWRQCNKFLYNMCCMRGTRKFCQRGRSLTTFFLCVFYEGREGPDNTKRGPSSARQRNVLNGVSLVGRWLPNIECCETGLSPPVNYFYWSFQGVALWIIYVISVLFLLCFHGKGLTSWFSFVMSNCEVVTFPLVSWVSCGLWLYRFLIFDLFLTLVALWFFWGYGPVLLRNPIFLCFFKGGGVRIPCPLLDPRMCCSFEITSFFSGSLYKFVLQLITFKSSLDR